ncbi:MAG TPA: secretin N-terminal domain-containing protein [Gemmatimonadaceae bacterium]|jgi:type II secretory pathway component GspD/PulD (secretin)|nr:secretin N-terminal domain-containing protein [Gemmatimonadaceae bacterium]
MTVRMYVCTMAALTCGSALSLAAQQPATGGDTTQAAPREPSRERGVALDFNDADIRAVITAIAQAGGIDFTYSDLPVKKISLHIHLPPGRASALALLKRIVKANDLYMTEPPHGGLLLISSLPPLADTSSSGYSYAIPDTELFVYRLKHANATRLADVLQAIFNGGTLSGAGAGITHRTLSQSLSQSGQGQSIALGGPGQAGPLQQGAAPNQQQGENNGQGGGRPGAARANARITIVPEESTNSLLIRADSADWNVVKQAIEAVDIRPLQVLIEVMIAEVQRNDDLNVGISSNANNQRTFSGRTLGSAVLPGDTATGSNFIANLTRYGAIDINLALSALKSRGDVRILSLPLIFAENNSESHLLVGSQQPFIESFTSQPTLSTAQNQVVQYRDVGTSLAILPTINSDGYVNLQVQQEISAATTEIQFGAPVISTREASASLFVKNGQTVVVGGLTDTQEEHTRTGIPILSDIPFIGGLFGTTTKTNTRTELFLFLTPHIVQDDDDLERIRSAIRKKASLLKDVPVVPYVVPGDSTGVAPLTSPSSPIQTIPLPKRP